MRRPFVPLLLGLVLLAPPLVAATAKKKAKPAPPAKNVRAPAGKKTVVKTRLVRTKSGKLARVAVRSAPAPSFQTHPDPERYVEIQKALADRGFFKGEANGQWGDDSTDALRRFQASANLPDDGKISALTLTGLGLGPRHDGSTASTVPLPASAPAASITGSTVGPAASVPASAPPTQSSVPPPLP